MRRELAGRPNLGQVGVSPTKPPSQESCAWEHKSTVHLFYVGGSLKRM